MALLKTTKLESRYGDFQALFGIDFEIHPGEIVAMIGANGAGKSTFLKTVCGLLKADRDGAGGAPAVSKPVGGREPADGRLCEAARPVEYRRDLRPFPAAEGQAPRSRHRAVRRPAADRGDRPRADEQSEAADLRRDLSGPGADRGERDLRRAAEHLRRRTDGDHRRA